MSLFPQKDASNITHKLLTTLVGSVGTGDESLHRRNDIKKVVSATPTVTVGTVSPVTNQYTAGLIVGGKLTFANAARGTDAIGGMIRTVIITDKSGSTAGNQIPYDLWLFNADISGSSTFADHGFLTIAAADLVKVVGFIPITAWSAANSGGGQAVASVDLEYVLAGTSMFGLLIARPVSGGPIFLSTSDITVQIALAQD